MTRKKYSRNKSHNSYIILLFRVKTYNYLLGIYADIYTLRNLLNSNFTESYFFKYNVRIPNLINLANRHRSEETITWSNQIVRNQ